MPFLQAILKNECVSWDCCTCHYPCTKHIRPSEIRRALDQDGNSKIKIEKADEVKITIIVTQYFPKDISPFEVVVTRTQLNNHEFYFYVRCLKSNQVNNNKTLLYLIFKMHSRQCVAKGSQ